MFVALYFDVGEYVFSGAFEAEDPVLDPLQFLDVVLVNLSSRSLVAERRYHLINSVMEPENVRVWLVILPLISVTTKSIRE